MGPNSIFRIVAKKNTTNGKMGGIGENRCPIFNLEKKFILSWKNCGNIYWKFSWKFFSYSSAEQARPGGKKFRRIFLIHLFSILFSAGGTKPVLFDQALCIEYQREFHQKN